MVATYEYDAYGNLLKETGNVENPYRYAGYRYDEETGLYYLQSRYYNPETGRFLTRDTFDGFENEPLTLNKYTYGNNNPVVMVDPDGKSAIKIIVVVFIGLAVISVLYICYKERRRLKSIGFDVKGGTLGCTFGTTWVVIQKFKKKKKVIFRFTVSKNARKAKQKTKRRA